jgi:hypothetical protein
MRNLLKGSRRATLAGRSSAKEALLKVKLATLYERSVFTREVIWEAALCLAI